MLYLWLFVVPVFVVLTILTALTVIVGCLLGGERIFAYYPGMICRSRSAVMLPLES